MKTVFISIVQGVEAKNILRTRIFEELRKRDDVRIVLFVQNEERKAYYEKEFHGPNIVYEPLTFYTPAPLDSFFQALQFFTLRTPTMRLKRKMAYEQHKNLIRYVLAEFLNIILSIRPIRKLIRTLDYLLVRDTNFTNLFDTYEPDAVFLAHLFERREVNILREAKRRNIASIGFINSWDKLTARCSLRLVPDRAVVFNEIVKAEAIQYADMSEKDIVVAGIPQYDRYAVQKPSSREAFFRRIGLDPKKKLIVYAPMGKAFSNSDWDIIDILHEGIESGVVENAELLVRFQPNDFYDEDELQKRPWLAFEWPGVRFSRERGVDWDMNFDDLEHLTNTLHHMSLLVCYASSMSIDAAVFDKPVININFEVREKDMMIKSPTYFYNIAHYQNALRTGGIRLANSKRDLIHWMQGYLQDPSRDREGRMRLVREQVWKTDGKAGERIAHVILEAIDLKSS